MFLAQRSVPKASSIDLQENRERQGDSERERDMRREKDGETVKERETERHEVRETGNSERERERDAKKASAQTLCANKPHYI